MIKEIEGLKKVWQDDDAAMHTTGYAEFSGHTVTWKKLYGTDFAEEWKAAKDTEVDCGDTFVRTMSNGVVVLNSFEGWSFYQKT